MPPFESTNLILAVIAVSAAGQLLLFAIAALWISRQVRLARTAFSRLEAQYVPTLTGSLQTLMAELRTMAVRVEQTGAAVERTARGAQAVVSRVEHEVERTTRGVHTAFDMVGQGVRRVAAVSTGLRVGLQHLLSRPRQDPDWSARGDIDAPPGNGDSRTRRTTAAEAS